MEQSLKYSQVTVQRPSLWTESLNSYVDNVLKVCFPQISVVSVVLGNNFAMHLQKSEDEFKVEILRKIKGDEGNKFRLYCEKILMDLWVLFCHLLPFS